MQHSGYFRTVLTPTTTTLVLPTVPADIFSLLWTSMASNSGLNLTETNVYQLLLYGQLLQMPTVVLQCKAYLTNLQQQQQHVQQPQQPLRPPITSTIVRPIPNKIQLWKPWMYSASLYQDWLTRLASNSAAQLEPAQFLNFSAMSQHSDTTTPLNENSTSEQVLHICRNSIVFSILRYYIPRKEEFFFLVIPTIKQRFLGKQKHPTQ